MFRFMLLLCCESLVGQVVHSIGWRHLKIGFDGLVLFGVFLLFFNYLYC